MISNGISPHPPLTVRPAGTFRRARRSSGRLLRAALLVGGLAATACGVRVADDLDEREANRLVTALGAEGVAADKVTTTGGAESRFAVEVARDDAAKALAVLGDSGLPRRTPAGVLEALGGGSRLVPSRTEEHARWLQGLSGELERTLEEIDGVVSARVHLSMERRDPLSTVPPALPGAAVLIKRRSGAGEVAPVDVKRLVLGAVPGLTAERIEVVQTTAGAPPAAADLVRVGPFSTPRAMATRLRLTLITAAGLNVLLVISACALWWRARRRAPASAP